MKIKFILFFLVISTALFAQESSPVRLKILCYNLRFGELASLEELAEYIRSEDPDLVALQEVDVNTHRERAPHQNGKNFISELAYRTNMLSAYGKTIPYSGGYYGIGILSKYPINATERILLPMPEGAKEQRAFLISHIELPGNSELTFVCTHLDHTTGEVRRTQIDAINTRLMKEKNPVVLCGDFNAKPQSPEIKEGMKDWLQACGVDLTIPSKSPRSKIDYIFCYPENRWKSIEASSPEVVLSDHRPVVASLELSF